MGFEVSKQELLWRLESEFLLFAEVVDRFTPVQALEPGLMGSWSLKDVLAHLIAHEQRALAELQAARQGKSLKIDHAGIHSFNDGAVFASRVFDFSMLREAWQNSHRSICTALSAIPEAEFLANSPTVNHLEDSIDGALANNSYAHYVEHRPRVLAWLEKLKQQID